MSAFTIELNHYQGAIMYDVLEELKGSHKDISCIYQEHPTEDLWLLSSDKPKEFIEMLKAYDGGFYQYVNALIDAIENAKPKEGEEDGE